jgi:hypothetical protein
MLVTARYSQAYSQWAMLEMFKIDEGGKHYIGNAATLDAATNLILLLQSFGLPSTPFSSRDREMEFSSRLARGTVGRWGTDLIAERGEALLK